jgi:hypothetical protein
MNSDNEFGERITDGNIEKYLKTVIVEITRQ